MSFSQNKKEEILLVTKSLRSSLLTRHHYLAFPSLVITNYYTLTQGKLFGSNLCERLINEDITINEILINQRWQIPRWIYLQEICLLMFFLEIKNKNKDFFYERVNGILRETFVERCLEIFLKVNRVSLNSLITSKKFKTLYKGIKKRKELTHIAQISLSPFTKNPNVKVGITNMEVMENDLLGAITDKPNLKENKRKKHFNLLNEAEKEKVDILLLPETSVPLDWLFAYTDESKRKNRSIIFGLEHFSHNNNCFNFSIAALPFTIGKTRDVLVVPRLKNHYSPSEEHEILTYGKLIPMQIPNFYHLFIWRNIQFTVFNCYELANISDRGHFKSYVDIVFAIEYNKDINYFSNVAESCCRDIHCFFAQANTSKYGDSRIVAPQETQNMNLVRVKGGNNNVILTHELNIEELRGFQKKRLPYQLVDKTFKPTPPDYNHAIVDKRGKVS